MIEQLVTVVHTMTRNTEEQLLDIQLKDVAYVMSREHAKEKGVATMWALAYYRQEKHSYSKKRC